MLVRRPLHCNRVCCTCLSHKNCYRAFASSGQRTAPEHAYKLLVRKRLHDYIHIDDTSYYVSTHLEHAVSLLRRRLSFNDLRNDVDPKQFLMMWTPNSFFPNMKSKLQ